MVRFIILSGFEEYTSEVAIYIPIWLDLLFKQQATTKYVRHKFTFQYGQIYYARVNNQASTLKEFTFQYGQIYYKTRSIDKNDARNIYIPIWLDLL